MGDRCYVHLICRKEDVPKFEQEVFQIEQHDEDDAKLVHMVDEQANYAASDVLARLAKLGVVFYGTHGLGDDYGPGAFVGCGRRYLEADTAFTSDGLIVTLDEDGGLDRQGLKAARAFLKLLKVAKRSLHQRHGNDDQEREA